jgi:hypothetical protein
MAAVHVDRQADGDGPHIVPLQKIEECCGILRELLSHDHGAWMREGKAGIRDGNTDRLVAQIEAGHRLARLKTLDQLFRFNDIQGGPGFPLTWLVRLLSSHRIKIPK